MTENREEKTEEQENKTGEVASRQMEEKEGSNCAYRFLTLVIPLKAFLGTAWIWFSLRSLERQTERQTGGERDRGRTH